MDGAKYKIMGYILTFWRLCQFFIIQGTIQHHIADQRNLRIRFLIFNTFIIEVINWGLGRTDQIELIRSVKIQFTSSGIRLLNDCKSVSTWAIFICNFEAAMVPAMVELVSPNRDFPGPKSLRSFRSSAQSSHNAFDRRCPESNQLWNLHLFKNTSLILAS